MKIGVVYKLSFLEKVFNLNKDDNLSQIMRGVFSDLTESLE